MTTTTDIRDILDSIATILYDAEPSPTKQSLDGSRGGRDKLPINPRLVDAKHHLKHTLTSWAILVAEETSTTIDCHDTSESIAGWLWQHSAHLANHEAAHDFTTEITDAVDEIRRCIDRGDDRIFLGVHAGEEIYARRGDKTVVFPDGEVRTVEEMLTWLKRKTLDVQGTAREVSIILNVVHGLTVSPKHISNLYITDQRERAAGRLGRHEGLDKAAQAGKQPVFVVDEVLTRLSKTGQAHHQHIS